MDEEEGAGVSRGNRKQSYLVVFKNIPCLQLIKQFKNSDKSDWVFSLSSDQREALILNLFQNILFVKLQHYHVQNTISPPSKSCAAGRGK